MVFKSRAIADASACVKIGQACPCTDSAELYWPITRLTFSMVPAMAERKEGVPERQKESAKQVAS